MGWGVNNMAVKHCDKWNQAPWFEHYVAATIAVANS